MSELIIRKAVAADLPVLLEFEQGIIAWERPFDPTLKPGSISYYDLGAMLQNTNAMIMVAEIGGKVIGSGYARIDPAKPYLRHEQYAYLGFMYVLPEYRGRGINKKIIDALKEWSSTQNIKEFRLEVYADNDPAIKAYEKIGFRKHMIEMRLE